MDENKLGILVAKLEAKIEVINQKLEANSQSVQAVAEEIGEVRQSTVDLDKTVSNLRKESAKAMDLVSSVQPDRFVNGLDENSAKLDELKSVVDSNAEKVNAFSDNLKEIHETVTPFTRRKSLVKMNDEVMSNLDKVQNLASDVESSIGKIKSLADELENQKNKQKYPKVTGETAEKGARKAKYHIKSFFKKKPKKETRKK